MASRSEYFAARLRSPTAQVIALALTFVLAGTAAFVGGLARDSLSSSGAAVGSLLGAVTASTGRQLFGLRATSPSGRSLAMQVIFDVVGAVAGSAILFYVAVVAFELQNSNAFNPAGTVLFGGVAGWLSATAIAGRLRAAEEFGAPFRTVASIINDLIDEKTPSLVPQVEALLRESLLGPEAVPYAGWLVRHWLPSVGPGPLSTGGSPRDLEVWLSTESSTGPEESDPVMNHRVEVSGGRPANAQPGDRFDAELVLHIPGDVRSPVVRRLTVPLEGTSEAVSFPAVPVTMPGSQVPVLELRVGNKIVTVATLPPRSTSP